MIFVLAWLWASALLLLMWGTALCLRQFSARPIAPPVPHAAPPVTILKPLKGVDPALRENLESFFTQEYPDYELIFSVADARDAACAVVRELVAAHPRVPARLITGDVEVGANPKVNNLVRSYAAARHEWLLISDSNVRVHAQMLKRLMAQTRLDTGIVTGVVVGRWARGLAGGIEAMALNTFYARGMVSAQGVGRPCVMGKCMLFKRSTAERFGGIKTLALYLAEDFMAGEAVLHLGLEVVLSREPVVQVIGRQKLRDYWARHVRWGRIRKTQAPLAFAAEPLSHSLVSGMLGAWAAHRAWGAPLAWFFAGHFGLWFLCDLALVLRLGGALGLATPLYWALREATALPLWLAITAGRTVKWRGRRLRLGPGGILTEV